MKTNKFVFSKNNCDDCTELHVLSYRTHCGCHIHQLNGVPLSTGQHHQAVGALNTARVTCQAACATVVFDRSAKQGAARETGWLEAMKLIQL